MKLAAAASGKRLICLASLPGFLYLATLLGVLPPPAGLDVQNGSGCSGEIFRRSSVSRCVWCQPQPLQPEPCSAATNASLELGQAEGEEAFCSIADLESPDQINNEATVCLGAGFFAEEDGAVKMAVLGRERTWQAFARPLQVSWRSLSVERRLPHRDCNQISPCCRHVEVVLCQAQAF